MTFKQRLATALEAMPEKKLGAATFYSPSTGCYCAVGAMLNHEGHDVVNRTDTSWCLLGVSMGETQDTTRENDSFKRTDEERHTHMLGWARDEADERAAAQVKWELS